MYTSKILAHETQDNTFKAARKAKGLVVTMVNNTTINVIPVLIIS